MENDSEIMLEVVPYSDRLRAAYEALLPEQTDGVMRGKLQWRFATNPAPGSVFSVAQRAGNIVGINAFMALRMRVRGALTTAYQSMDTIVDASCRGQGLFSRLITLFYAAAPGLHASILYGFPNGNSAHGFFNKLGWHRLGTPPFLVKPLRAGYFLKKILKGKARFFDFPLAYATPVADGIVTLTRFDARVDALWQAFSASINCALERDHTYLNWRLNDHPEMRYTTKAVEGSDGALLAFVTYIALQKHGGHIGYVMEALALPGHEKSLAILLRNMNAEFIENKVDAVLAWCPAHAPNYRQYRQAGFWKLPEKLRPITLHFGCRPLDETLQPLTYADWYVSYLDSDTV